MGVFWLRKKIKLVCGCWKTQLLGRPDHPPLLWAGGSTTIGKVLGAADLTADLEDVEAAGGAEGAAAVGAVPGRRGRRLEAGGGQVGQAPPKPRRPAVVGGGKAHGHSDLLVNIQNPINAS